MSDIIFAKTRWHYDSYTDYWTLVELSGFPIVYVDEMDPNSGDVYIISPLNGEMHEYVKNVIGKPIIDTVIKSTFILWNLERPGDKSYKEFANDNYDIMRNFVHEVIVSDYHFAKNFGLLYAPMGIHEGLGVPGAYEDKKYDLIHLSCYSNHRSELFNTPSEPKSIYRGASVASNGWGEHRLANLQAAKFMLNVHQDGQLYIEPCRFTLAVAYGLPIITESLWSPYPYNNVLSNKMTFLYDFANLEGVVASYDKTMYDNALRYRDKFIERYPFRKCVEKIIREYRLSEAV